MRKFSRFFRESATWNVSGYLGLNRNISSFHARGHTRVVTSHSKARSSGGKGDFHRHRVSEAENADATKNSTQQRREIPPGLRDWPAGRGLIMLPLLSPGLLATAAPKLLCFTWGSACTPALGCTGKQKLPANNIKQQMKITSSAKTSKQQRVST